MLSIFPLRNESIIAISAIMILLRFNWLRQHFMPSSLHFFFFFSIYIAFFILNFNKRYKIDKIFYFFYLFIFHTFIVENSGEIRKVQFIGIMRLMSWRRSCARFMKSTRRRLFTTAADRTKVIECRERLVQYWRQPQKKAVYRLITNFFFLLNFISMPFFIRKKKSNNLITCKRNVCG